MYGLIVQYSTMEFTVFLAKLRNYGTGWLNRPRVAAIFLRACVEDLLSSDVELQVKTAQQYDAPQTLRV